MLTGSEPSISLAPAKTVPEVLATMESISAALPKTDGLACFNSMYLEVTRAVAAALDSHSFSDGEFLARLDIAFANIYFEAVNLYFQGSARASRAWAPLFSARNTTGISPLRFALAGMNAHINHDLCIAVVRVCEERAQAPEKNSAQHLDFMRINQILRSKEGEMKERFLSGFLKELDAEIGVVDDAVAMWNIEEARNIAWDHAAILWHLRSSPELTADYLSLLERGVGVASRGLLIASI